MDNEIIDQGLRLMVVGMGTVFAFLTILVAATAAMSAILQRVLPAPAQPAAAGIGGATAAEVAAITAAIAQHRQRQQQA